MSAAVREDEAARVLAMLAPALRARIGAFDVMATIDSTQAELLRRGAAQPDVSVLVADHQDAGRGRRGRAWVSPPGANLYLSMFRRGDGGLRAQAGLSLALGIAAAEALRGLGVDAVGVKWPNDLYAQGRKLGGLLIETSEAGLVAGIGVNLDMPTEAQERIDQPWIDLAALGLPIARAEVAAAIVAGWIGAFDRFAQDGLAAFAQRWARLDVLADAPVRVSAASGERVGIARGIAGDGALRVEIDGAIVAVHSGDVSLRPA